MEVLFYVLSFRTTIYLPLRRTLVRLEDDWTSLLLLHLLLIIIYVWREKLPKCNVLCAIRYSRNTVKIS